MQWIHLVVLVTCVSILHEKSLLSKIVTHCYKNQTKTKKKYDINKKHKKANNILNSLVVTDLSNFCMNAGVTLIVCTARSFVANDLHSENKGSRFESGC